MIVELLLFTLGCMLAGEFLKGMKWHTAWIIVAAPGVPMHELGHVVACLLFRVPIKHVDLLHVDTTPESIDIGGSVSTGTPGSVFAAITLAISPIVSCWLFIELFLWLFVSWPAWGFDPAWQWLLGLFMLSTGLSAAPSGADLAFIGRAAREHPGQLATAIGGIILGIFIACLVISQIPEAWQVLAGSIIGHCHRQATSESEGNATSNRWTQDSYMKRYPEYNRACAVCGKMFNVLHLGSRRRKTCSAACSEIYTKRLQRENTKRYIKSEKYLAYRKKYYEAVKARRRLAKIKEAMGNTKAISAT